MIAITSSAIVEKWVFRSLAEIYWEGEIDLKSHRSDMLRLTCLGPRNIKKCPACRSERKRWSVLRIELKETEQQVFMDETKRWQKAAYLLH